MSENLHSAGWSVQPTFVPNAPHFPVTLMSDDAGLTQLAGEPPVAWQTPWSEISNLQLVRFARGLVLFATVDGVRYSWRTPRRDDFESMRELVSAHGGVVEHHRRRAGMLAVALVVLIASLGGALGAWFNRAGSRTHELAALNVVNLTLKDLPSTWSVAGPSVLSYLFSPAGQVITSTSTTAPVRGSTWSKVSSIFQSCIGVSAGRDRIYGAAGQMPDYQVASPVFTSLNGDIVLVSMTQYYHSTTMVNRDRAEMSRPGFGSCLATSNVALLFSAAGQALPTKDIGSTWNPVTFVHGFARGGVVRLPTNGSARYLVIVTTASGHYEVTLGALVASWTAARATITALVNTLLARTSSNTSTAA